MEIRMSKKLIYLSLLLSFILLTILIGGYYYVIYNSGVPQISNIFSSIKIRLIGLLVIAFVSFIPYYSTALKMFFNRLFITDAEVKITSFLNSQIVPVKQIADVHLNSNIIQKIFGIGDTSFETTGGKIFLFNNIDAVLEKDIIQALNL